MKTKTFESPVALFVFKRAETTRRVFDVVSRVRPARLLLIADGPRLDREGESEECQQVRNMVTRVDWPCEISTNFSDVNLGCRERIISGLNWVFSLVEEAIILEDDCLPDLSFFPFCHEMLERYRGDSRVAAISGTNLVEKYVKSKSSYFFSQLGGNWGWATWRTEWERFDGNIEDWPQLRSEGMLSEVFVRPKAIDFWTDHFDMVYQGRGPSAWDIQWLYTHLKNNALTVVPSVNLVTNIGFGEGATHTLDNNPRFAPPTKAIDFPLIHPSSFAPLRSLDDRFQDILSRSWFRRAVSRFRRMKRGFLSR
jgi:hypothetical protein